MNNKLFFFFYFTLILVSGRLLARGRYTGFTGGHCVYLQETDGEKPADKPCGWSIEFEKHSKKSHQKYQLFHNHPRQVFLFNSEYRIMNRRNFYYRYPIIGEIRDRFVNQRALKQSMLFTVSAFGLAYKYFKRKYLALHISSDVVYMKQRYGGFLLHTATLEDPEAERLFGFEQWAQSATFSLSLASKFITISGEARLLKPLVEHESLFDLEFHSQLSLKFAAIIFQISHFARSQNLRLDEQIIDYRSLDGGLVVQF